MAINITMYFKVTKDAHLVVDEDGRAGEAYIKGETCIVSGNISSERMNELTERYILATSELFEIDPAHIEKITEAEYRANIEE